MPWTANDRSFIEIRIINEGLSNRVGELAGLRDWVVCVFENCVKIARSPFIQFHGGDQQREMDGGGQDRLAIRACSDDLPYVTRDANVALALPSFEFCQTADLSKQYQKRVSSKKPLCDHEAASGQDFIRTLGMRSLTTLSGVKLMSRS
jgi:hypothetical protein